MEATSKNWKMFTLLFATAAKSSSVLFVIHAYLWMDRAIRTTTRSAINYGHCPKQRRLRSCPSHVITLHGGQIASWHAKTPSLEEWSHGMKVAINKTVEVLLRRSNNLKSMNLLNPNLKVKCIFCQATVHPPTPTNTRTSSKSVQSILGRRNDIDNNICLARRQ